MAKKKQKIRVQFQKNRQKNPQKPQLTHQLAAEGLDSADMPTAERVSGKGDKSRYRTIIGFDDESGDGIQRQVASSCLNGRVLSSGGATCTVQTDDGRRFECTIRRVVKTLARDERTAVVAGDRVAFQPELDQTGVIERVNPRHGTLSRGSRQREHVLVANVDQVLIVVSADDPPLKPNLVDRYLISAELGGLRPLLCINKVDLVDEALLQPLVGMYSQLGYQVVLASASGNRGIHLLRRMLQDRESVVTGQSGVGKSSLLNAVQPGLALRTGDVSAETRKGRHTTTRACLLPLIGGGWVVDTPGIRQFELWQVAADDVAGYFKEFRPFFHQCKFPDCSHTHEHQCGVKHAVDRELIARCRYESYLKILSGEPA